MKAAAVARSSCEKDFVLKYIAEGSRLDGRDFYDYRDIDIQFGDEFGHCQVSIGATRCLAQVSCEIVKPPPNRASEGQIFLNVELSPMASPQFEAGRPSVLGMTLNRFIERCLRESRPVDLESLCIVTGEKVWTLRVDVTVMDDAGNVLDCACIAAISALGNFRYPDVSVVGEQVKVHSLEEKDPVPLNVYHFPVCVTLGFIKSGDKIIVDPTSLEEDILSGSMMIAMNANREICCAQMSGGVFLEPDQIIMCSKLAFVKVAEITKLIKRGLEKDKKKRAPAQVAKQSISAKTFDDKLADLSGLRPITQTVGEKTVIDLTDAKRSGEETARGVAPDWSKRKTVQRQGPNTASIGSGGPSSWIVVSDDDSDVVEVQDGDVMETRRISGDKGNGTNGIDVVMIGSDHESEEEETVTLTSEDIGSHNYTSTQPNKAKADDHFKDSNTQNHLKSEDIIVSRTSSVSIKDRNAAIAMDQARIKKTKKKTKKKQQKDKT